MLCRRGVRWLSRSTKGLGLSGLFVYFDCFGCYCSMVPVFLSVLGFRFPVFYSVRPPSGPGLSIPPSGAGSRSVFGFYCW